MTTEATDDAVRTAAYDDQFRSEIRRVLRGGEPDAGRRASASRACGDRALELLADNGRSGPYDVIDIGCGAGTQAMLWAAAGTPRARPRRQPAPDHGRASARRAGRHRGSVRRRNRDRRFPTSPRVRTSCSCPSCSSTSLSGSAASRRRSACCVPAACSICPPPTGCARYSMEFNLPAYGWYPRPLKRWCERKAVTTHRHWVEHARYPAVNWFTYFSLSRWLRVRGFRTFDRFDMLSRRPLSTSARAAVDAVRALPPLRVLRARGELRHDGLGLRESRHEDPVSPPHAARRTAARCTSMASSQALRAQGNEVIVVAPPVATTRATPPRRPAGAAA